MKKVLIIDNNIEPPHWGAWEITRFKVLLPEASFYIRRAPHSDLPKDPLQFDKIIVSGSLTSVLDEDPWTHELQNFLKTALNRHRPIFGICYGHQILAKTLFGKDHVGKSETPEFGWHEMRLLKETDFTRGLPQKFHTFCSHFDEVHTLPSDVPRLVESDRCGIQGFEHPDVPAFAVQFHPERDLAGAARNYSDAKRDKIDHLYENIERGEELWDPHVAENLFRNFLRNI